VIWGVAFVFQKKASFVPPFALLAMRSIVAVVFLIFAIAVFDKVSGNGRRLFSHKEKKIDLSKNELIGGAVCGTFLLAASAAQQIGIGGTDAGKTAFITSLYVLLVPIIGMLLGKKAPLNALISVGIAVIGFYLLCIKKDFSVEPSDLLVLSCAFLFALQILSIDRYAPMCDGVRLSLVQFATVTVESAIISLIFEPTVPLSTVSAALPDILYLGIASSGIAYTLQIIGQKRSEPTVASIIMCLESVIGAIASAIILHERMLPREYLGSAIVFFAVILSQLTFGKKKPGSADACCTPE
jgi:drug/metabolite transporter (DMT)-like permease